MPDYQEQIKKLFQITTYRMYTALESFYLWKKMNQMMNVNEVGTEKADENVGVFKKHWNFFHPVLNGTYKAFVTDLAVFFDAEKYEDTFSLGKLVNLVKLKISVTEHNVLIDKIEHIKRKHGVRINFLLELRNAEVSHQEIERKKRLIIYSDIEELFLGVQEILNLIAQYNDRSFTMWEHVGENATHSIDWVMENLVLGEKQRLKILDDKFNIGVSND